MIDLGDGIYLNAEPGDWLPWGVISPIPGSVFWPIEVRYEGGPIMTVDPEAVLPKDARGLWWRVPNDIEARLEWERSRL